MFQVFVPLNSFAPTGLSRKLGFPIGSSTPAQPFLLPLTLGPLDSVTWMPLLAPDSPIPRTWSRAPSSRLGVALVGTPYPSPDTRPDRSGSCSQSRGTLTL